MTRIEQACKGLYESTFGDRWSKRIAVADHFGGYLDSSYILHLYETSGYPLEESAAKAAEYGMKLDKRGLKHELLMLGMNESSVNLAIQRMAETWNDISQSRVKVA